MAGKRKKTADSKLRSLGVRVPEETWEILDIACMLRGSKSMQELIAPMVVEFASELAKEAAVQDIVKAKREYAASQEGSLTRLSSRSKDADSTGS